MLKRLLHLLKPQAWLLAVLIITAALPARAQDEFYDEFYDDQGFQEFLFNFEYRDDLNGYIVSPNRSSGANWDSNEGNMLQVPSIYLGNGKPVVGLSGFGSLEYLNEIIFPENCHVTYICDNCFEYCTSLGSTEPLTLPSTIETIGDYAFYGCSRITEINLPGTLTYIGVSAFEKCTSLESITLPKSLKVIREFAFRNCATFDNWGNFTGGGLKSVTFEDGVDFYNANDFYCFYNNVFWGCANLSEVKLPQNTPDSFIIPMGTFGYCSNLKSIEFPPNTGKIEQMAFYRSGLETLDLTNITWKEPFYLSGYYTFAACENLTTVKANGKVKFDGLYIFQDCKKLETVTFSRRDKDDDYTVMSPDIFKYCDNLRSVEFYRLKGNGYSNDMDSVFTGCKSLVSVTSVCPPEISKIGYSCFDGCESLTTLTLPQTKFVINETAFRNCKSLTSLELADLTSIGTKAFTGCTALTSIKFTNNPPTTTIEDAFDEWHFNNTLIDVLDEKYSVFVADAVWQKFLKLKHPALFAYSPVEGGYSIAKGQFALAEDFAGMLEIPTEYETGKVVAIAEGAFEGLTGITGVTLHKDLTAIGANAFAGCTGITTVISERAEPLTADASTFAEQAYSGTLTVPFGSLDAYKNCAPWSAFSTIEQGLGERTLAKPTSSHESCIFKESFDLTLTNPNESGTIYYYVIPKGDTSTGVRSVVAYEGPIAVPATDYTVVAYITDGTACSEPISLEFTLISCRINGTESVPEGSQVVGFKTDPEYSLDNVVIGNIYYSINDEAGGMDSTNGLVLNATTPIEVVHQFNSAVENGITPATYFNGLAVKVQGVGSITFTGVENNGNARLTMVLGNGPAVYVDELVDGKYEFALPAAKYLYIFATQTAPLTAPQFKAPAPGENSVTLTSMTLNVSDLYISTETGLDKILAANPGESYRIGLTINLKGHYYDGTYLYASTEDGTGSSRNTYNLGKAGNEGSDDYMAYQGDWVAIKGLTEDYLGWIQTTELVVDVVSNDAYPVISFPVKPDFALVTPPSTPFDTHSFRVENFNFKADHPDVNNIWLIAPQPAEYCTLRGFVRMENIHAEDSYLELWSREWRLTEEDGTTIEPLTMKVYYDSKVSKELTEMAWYVFTGIVSREGKDLVFTARTADYEKPSAIEDIEAASGARISAANGTIHVACDTPTTIAVYTMTGQLIATVEATTATIPVAPGLYLVKAGPQATKLSVK